MVQLRRRLLGMTWLWVAVFVLGTSLLVVPGRPSHYPVLAAGDVAPGDIVINRDIVLPDPDATEQARRRASLAVLPVYDFDTEVEKTVVGKLERVFQEGHLNPKGNTADLAARLSEVSGVLVQRSEAQALRSAHFSEDLLATLREIVSRLYHQGIVSNRQELLLSSDHGITLRMARTGEEHVELDIYRFLDGAGGLGEAVEQRLAAEPTIKRSWRGPLAALLTRMLVPNVLIDRGETLARRLKAASQVQEVMVHLSRGRVLLRRGDEVSPQVARLLQALATGGRAPENYLPYAGVILLVSLLAATWLFFLKRMSPSPEEYRSRFGALAILTILVLLIERGTGFLAGAIAASVMRDPFGHIEVYLPALPHAVGPLLAGMMFGVPVAILFAVVQTVLVALVFGGDIGVAVYALVAGVAAAFVSQRLKERNVLVRAGVAVALVNAVVVVSLAFWHGKIDNASVLAVQAAAGASGGLVAAILASFLLPLLESLTGTITDIRLLELANPNLPLLKRLSIEAPGTFQHSLAMANLAESAAEAIGANPLLARVCCYYHDIGKLAKPEYFVENQRGENPHDNLTPWMSALVVSNHVKAGLELARAYKLPEPIREAITTHHGNKLIRYFYSRAKQQENKDRGEVQENEFRYPGPRPHSKEMGILLLSDALEAASRTLQEPTPGRIQSMIDQIIKNVLEDGQLDECDLTLKDIEKIGAAFFWVLTNAFHHRIDYPGFDFNRQRRVQ
jgi:cyclic-di-AMP phosphodiesterase PgpH